MDSIHGEFLITYIDNLGIASQYLDSLMQNLGMEHPKTKTFIYKLCNAFWTTSSAFFSLLKLPNSHDLFGRPGVTKSKTI